MIVLDLAVPEAGPSVVARAIERFGGVDVLVNNVGWTYPNWFAESEPALWQRMFDVNLVSTFSCTKAALAPLAAGGQGAIVFISSDAAVGEVRQAVYGATKAALIAFARSIAKEHGRHGVRANVVCPGVVIPGESAVGEGSLWADPSNRPFGSEQECLSFARAVPLRELPSATDVAAATVWFASPTAARMLTGQVLSVSGGYSMP